MKKLFFCFLVLFFSNLHYANAQKYTQLIPSMKPAEKGSLTNVPDYGSLLITIQQEVLQWANNKCQESINKQVRDDIEKERSTVKTKTVYLVVVNITAKLDCKVETFRPLRQGEDPAVLHDDKTSYLVYTLDVYPWIMVGGKRY